MSFPSPIRTSDFEALRDSCGRVINNLRISVTDRCNFRCRYCMPENGMVWMKKSDLLTYEEIDRLARLFADLGVCKIRLTGGEPLMRKDLHRLVKRLAAIPGIGDLALTTNGYFLEEQANDLIRAGLGRVNVSLDSLDASTFNGLTRRDYYAKVWKGLEIVQGLGVGPIKINVVLIRGVNDDEIGEFGRLARARQYIVRFIEFMPIGLDDDWSSEKVVPAKEVVERLEKEIGTRLQPIERWGRQPADRYVFDDGIGEIGFISSVSEPFCERCNRVRITSDGKLRTCLFSLEETDLKGPLREGSDDEQLKHAILEAVWNKERGHLINRPDFVRPGRTMSQIGG
ncbi:MAG: GTP 3',8-cyclase MoaA [Ignavibacteria bacterium]|nr:GTP 3',8-cyclase MoaA [Ignavibacteria bacterium]